MNPDHIEVIEFPSLYKISGLVCNVYTSIPACATETIRSMWQFMIHLIKAIL